MHFRFDDGYVARSHVRVAMFVANGVVGDSRVLKTAQTVKKLGYNVTVYGLGRVKQPQRVLKYEFPTVLLPNPALEMKRAGTWPADPEARDYAPFTEMAADHLAQALKADPPDILHTHDMIGLAVGAAYRARSGHTNGAWIHDIHEYTSGLTELPERTRRFFADVETRQIHAPDRLTCVSPALADILVEAHGLPGRPDTVLNAPRHTDFDPHFPMDVRSAVGLREGPPLLVYSGGVKPVRGVATIIDSLAQLQEMHLAIVSNARGGHVDELIARAEELGVRERIHFHDYVPFMNVTSFLRTATIGVHPIHRYPNAEIALPNKLTEYLHAGLPAVVSDNPAMADFVRRHDCGLSFPTGDAAALADRIQRAVTRLRAEPAWIANRQSVAAEVAWEQQERVIAEQYAAVDGIGQDVDTLPGLPSGTRILQLPTAAANQPATLAKALRARAHVARSLQIGRHKFGYQSDIYFDEYQGTRRPSEAVDDVLSSYDILHYHARPLTYRKDFAHPCAEDLWMARLQGRKVFFHFRGSEARLPSVFQDNSPYHYLEETPEDLSSGMPEDRQRLYHGYVNAVAHRTFVVDPELQTYVPEALIVPRATDLGPPSQAVRRDSPLRVVHAPSRRAVKGTQAIREAVGKLQQDGVAIELQLVEDMSHKEALAAYREADVVVDQLRIGWYGVVAVESMAMGKAVVSFVRDDLKHHLPSPWPLAVANPMNVAGVLEDLAADRDLVDALGRRARAYAEELHDSSRIAEVLDRLYASPGRPAAPRAAATWFGLQTRIAAEQAKKQEHGSRRTRRRFLPSVGGPAAKTGGKRSQAPMVRHIVGLFRTWRRDGPGQAARTAYRFLLKRLT